MISQFEKEFAFLSNFFLAPIVGADGLLYPTAEHAYQAAKTLDKTIRSQIALLPTPGQAKRAGQRVTLRKDWNEVRFSEMHEIVSLKFTQHPELAEMLVKTGNEELVEGNLWHDNIWGICQCGTCSTGTNWLGKILMMVRADLQQKPGSLINK